MNSSTATASRCSFLYINLQKASIFSTLRDCYLPSTVIIIFSCAHSHDSGYAYELAVQINTQRMLKFGVFSYQFWGICWEFTNRHIKSWSCLKIMSVSIIHISSFCSMWFWSDWIIYSDFRETEKRKAILSVQKQLQSEPSEWHFSSSLVNFTSHFLSTDIKKIIMWHVCQVKNKSAYGWWVAFVYASSCSI